MWARLAFLFVFALSFAARADEAILSFDSRIAVDKDAGITITETIQVRAEGREIKRGIYRDLPTVSKTADDGTRRTVYHIDRVLRDGAPIATFETGEGGGRRIHFGSKDIYIDPGVYTYTFVYRVPHQVAFLADVEGIYWNVTGNAWAFPILSASATVEAPPGAEIVQHSAYTGRHGEAGADFTAGVSTPSTLQVATTRALRPGEGLTVAVGWPPGAVTQPDAGARAGAVLFDNLHVVVGVVGTLLVLAYYLFAWDRVGRDPAAGPVAPLFDPPKGYSPAMARALMKMKVDDKAFSAAIVSLAVKGAVRIEEDGGDFTLIRQPFSGSAQLSKGEKGILDSLLRSSPSIRLHKDNHAKISSAIEVFKTHLKSELEATHYNTNAAYLIPAALLSLAAVGGMVLAGGGGGDPHAAAFLTIWLSIWTFACFVLVRNVYRAFRAGGIAKPLLQGLFVLPFLGGEVMGAGFLIQVGSAGHVAFLLLHAGLFGLFLHLLKAPTLRGRRVMDKVEGFRMFLDVAEKHRLEAFHPPHVTPEVFESYLPYALALDVEHGWSRRFSRMLADAGMERSYHPHWYHGAHWDAGDVGGFANHLGGGFTSSVTSSAQSPSSGGFGGGGSSGGGGGGGGGGGF
ncbi:MAG: DUF2207 domain-containing protein [Alphaproteobacteria bacterium]|nr:DUF2207 domain-containing protein [Alphaproteobacteria bacterium]